MLRLIREIRPTWVIGENVSGLLSMEDGATLERICLDLEGEGYEVQPYHIGAAGVGACHRRMRVWIVARRTSERSRGVGDKERPQRRKGPGILPGEPRREAAVQGDLFGLSADTQYDGSHGSKVRGGIDTSSNNDQEGQDCSEQSPRGGESTSKGDLRGNEQGLSSDTHLYGLQRDVHRGSVDEQGRNRPVEPFEDDRTPDRSAKGAIVARIHRVADGISDWLDEPPRPTTTETKGRAARIKQLGNAICPLNALAIFEIIKAYEHGKNE